VVASRETDADEVARRLACRDAPARDAAEA
jgi:hypothetical protein